MFFTELAARQYKPIFPAGDGDYHQTQSEPEVLVRYKMTVGPIAPTNPDINDIWIDTSV